MQVTEITKKGIYRISLRKIDYLESITKLLFVLLLMSLMMDNHLDYLWKHFSQQYYYIMVRWLLVAKKKNEPTNRILVGGLDQFLWTAPISQILQLMVPLIYKILIVNYLNTAVELRYLWARYEYLFKGAKASYN